MPNKNCNLCNGTGFRASERQAIEGEQGEPCGCVQYTYTFNGRKDPSGDYIVRAYKDGKRYPDGDYFTTEKDDAIGTKAELEKRAKEEREG